MVPAGGIIVPIEFGAEEWDEEVGRYQPDARPRLSAERARRQIEAGAAPPRWLRCKTEGPNHTSLPGCLKLYVPLDGEGASASPYGFVFQLAQKADATLFWSFIAFGERHPSNSRTRTVYERAHKRLHGRYP